MDPENPMPPEGVVPEPPAAEQQPEGNPWESWQSAGIDPSAFDPHEVRNAANFFQALKNPDQRQYALSYLANQLRPEEREQFFAPGDPAASGDEGGYYGDPGPDEYGYEGEPSGLTAEQVQQIVQQQMSEFQKQQQERLQQERVQQEFERELMRVKQDAGYDDPEMTWVAATALNLRQQDPFSTTAQLVDKARAQYDAQITRRLQQQAERQRQAAQQAPVMPAGDIPSPDQAPTSPEEAFALYQRMAGGGQ